MKITAVAPWFGSKRTLAPEIIRELGPHRKYDEPFCASMAVLMAKEVATCETVNDLHGDLINLARVLKCEDAAVELYARLSRFVMHEELFHEAAERYRIRGYQPADEAPDVSRAEDFMICSWYGRNGVAGTKSYNQGFCVRYTANGGHAATRWLSAVESIPPWHWRLRAVTILNRDAFELLERYDDDPSAVIYVDPPYIVKGASYIYDADDSLPAVRRVLGLGPSDPLPTFAWHRALAKLLRRFERARVVLSYYDHPLLAELYSGWTVRSLDVTKSLVNQGARSRSTEQPVIAPERLLINGRSMVAHSVKGLF